MYSSNLIVNSPNMAGLFRCKDCHMTFNNQQLLAKHKLKFCVGTTGDPNDLQLRRGLRSTSPPRLISPDDRGKVDDAKPKPPIERKPEENEKSEVLAEKDDFRRNPNQDQQLRNLAESHGRQMEYLQQRNKDLEKQREDIRRQLEGLGRKSVIPAHDNTDALLQELREQERRNQRNIDELRRELMAMNNQKVNVIEIEKPVYPAPQPAPPPPQQPSPEPKRNFVLPVFYGKSLVAEICAIRQAYLQNGGNDPEVLAQMAQMQAEAQAIEDQMNKEPEKRPREKPKDSFGQLNFLEMENDRLKQELALLQEQNLLAQQRRKSDKEDELERELRRLQREHLDKMYGLQKELDDLRILLMLERNRPQPQAPQPTTIVHQQPPQPPVSLKPYVEVEPMAPYDQYPKGPPSFHHTWNYTQYFRPQAVPQGPPPRNIDFSQPSGGRVFPKPDE